MAEEEKKEKNTSMAVVGLLIPIIPLLTEDKKDPYVKYYTKQGIVLWITSIGLEIIMNLLVRFVFSFFAWGILSLINFVIGLFLLVLVISGIMNALSGKEKPLPVVGKFGDKFKF
jgi:uncharacterized membrane protein